MKILVLSFALDFHVSVQSEKNNIFEQLRFNQGIAISPQ